MKKKLTALALTGALSRFGIVENYNRKTLQKRKNSLTGQDLLVLVSGRTGGDDPGAAARFRNLSGARTSFFLFADETAEDDGAAGILQSRGFCLRGADRMNFSFRSDDAVRKAALAIRNELDNMAD